MMSFLRDVNFTKIKERYKRPSKSFSNVVTDKFNQKSYHVY